MADTDSTASSADASPGPAAVPDAAAHHLILVRAGDPATSGSIGCCCRLGPDDLRWDDAPRAVTPPHEPSVRFAALYGALRRHFGGRVEITVLDPRNLVSFLPLVVRDAVRHRVPPREALSALGAISAAGAVLDGRLLYGGALPPAEEVLALVAERLRTARTGARPAAAGR